MKIKKIVSAISAATIVLSLTACSDNASTSNVFDIFNSGSSSASSSSSLKSSSSSSSSSTKSSSSSTSSKKESSSSSSESKPEETTGTPLITRYYINNYGTGVFEFTADDKKRYVYNITENKLIELGENNSGITCAMGNILYLRNIDSNKIIDAKSQEVVLQSGEDGYIIRDVSEVRGKILVTKLEDGFSGNKLFIGIMNSKGEWDNQLTEISIDKITASRLNGYEFRLLGDNVLMLSGKDSYIYSLSKKVISPVKYPDNVNPHDSMWSFAIWNKAGNQAIINAYNQSKKGYEVFCFDDSAEFRAIYSYNDGFNYSDNGFNYISNDGIYVKDKKIYTLINPKTSEVIGGFDLSEYNFNNMYSLNEKWIVFSARNPDGVLYTIILDKDGNFVVDPIKESGRFSPYICNDCVILNSNTIVNCNTGEVKTTDYTIERGYVDYGLIVVRADNNYYLVKPSEPDKLINPFEIATRV